MRIAVCAKFVPEAAASARIDAQTKRLDRSGEGALNPFDVNAVEEALKLKEAEPESEVVVVSVGPERALEAMRKALAMGADRVVLVSDDAAAGSDLVATSRILAAALEQNVAGSSAYSFAPRSLKCIATPGLVGGGARPAEAAPKSLAPASKKPAKK